MTLTKPPEYRETSLDGLESLLEAHGFLALIPSCICPVLYTSSSAQTEQAREG